MQSSRTLLPTCSRSCTSARHRILHHFHSSASASVLRQRLPPAHAPAPRSASATARQPQPAASTTSIPEVEDMAVAPIAEDPRYAHRNELGVQLLSRSLHRQIFKQTSFPAPPPEFVQIAKSHLKQHGLDPAQGSVLPPTAFNLPPLQGANLDEHFHRLGAACSQPWLSLASSLADARLPAPPDEQGWSLTSGWTKYYADGCHHHVAYPGADADGQGPGEEMLVFDVETLPKYSPYPIMACAASPNGWYAWISPWLLGETEDPAQLVPLGPKTTERVVVGHNVSYDRARIREEYDLHGTKTRFLDTMALHVAVRGISSHQRPAWQAHRKKKEEAAAQADEAHEAVEALLHAAQEEEKTGTMDERRREALRRMRIELEESLAHAETEMPSAATPEDVVGEDIDGEGKRWEDLTSANSLADVALLHCGIAMDKSTRNDFMTRTREDIREGIREYLDYCASDVDVTHKVYSRVLPAFRKACPSPVSFAGILTMGSAFLPVNEEWERYIERAERTYRELDEKVKSRLVDLARQAKEMMESEGWKEDPWLSQLDWEPKTAGASRGVSSPVPSIETSLPSSSSSAPSIEFRPKWYLQVTKDPLHPNVVRRLLPYMLRATYNGAPLRYDTKYGWHHSDSQGTPIRIATGQKSKVLDVFSAAHGKKALDSRVLLCDDMKLASALSDGAERPALGNKILKIAQQLLKLDVARVEEEPSLSQLDWTPVSLLPSESSSIPVISRATKQKPPKPAKPPPILWPKWYWDLARPKKGMEPGTLDITVRNSLAPLLLRLAWQGWPLFRSREHGWTFRVPRDVEFKTRAKQVDFADEADARLAEQAHDSTEAGEGGGEGKFVFYKLPHKDGDKANVGSPLAKTFMKYAQDGTLTSPGDEAKDALDMNAQCSYWISARDRVLNQLVLWQREAAGEMGFPQSRTPGGEHKWGLIIPQVITMGTVTRRAIEKTWLTASNAKKNRVGSELKAMVRAPPGYAIVGADVDSEELWISSLMGDAQFGLHGATAIGWMTLEGTKAAGTDLHSKTASILGISRDQAKVFNYSRIYGAGMRHAVLLLLQANAGMLPEQAQKLAEELYAQTKGKNTHSDRFFGRKFWHGGTESFVFNKLESIALNECPQTPALGCGVTSALTKSNLQPGFGTDYMTSRINWVVQSSGVDYLHMLIVAMDYLTRTYDIGARYLISVHDEVRYLVTERDRYRAALALQIANLWTRAMFAYKLGMDDLPQGVAFFSAVDVDSVLRKEVDMPCVTPSQPNPLPPGESLSIAEALERTSNGSLWPDGRPMSTVEYDEPVGNLEGYTVPDCLVHRAHSREYLRAQATTESNEIRLLAQQASAFKAPSEGKSRRLAAGNADKRWKKALLGNGEGLDIDRAVEEYMKADAWAQRDAI